MKKLTPEDPETRSADVIADNLNALQRLFPDAFIEGKVDLDVLGQLLGGAVDDRDEKYGLTWHGKRAARQIALTPSTGTLRPCPDESVNWNDTRNVMIEGDNLEVLKLLQKGYCGRVKLIFIDPPYNTGNDFIYQDHFGSSIENYLAVSGQREAGGPNILSNPEAGGRFHTRWLNMMYPRLRLAASLLSDTGSLFVTIDDHEVANLRGVLDEIFGYENFVASIAWQKVFAKKNKALISGSHDHILVYAKDIDRWSRNLLPRGEAQLAAFKNPDSDPRGPWQSVSYSVQSEDSERRKDYRYEIMLPSGRAGEAASRSTLEWPSRSLYAGVPFSSGSYFLYDSSKLGQVRNFATSPHIQIMVTTVGAINKKDVNNLYKDSEKVGGEKPIDLIRATAPVLIVDEPQSVDGGLQGQGKKALDEMHPLCTLRYSATHVNKHHMLYRLDAVDAYERKLVKQIEVASATVQGGHNKPYVRFVAPVVAGKRVVGAKLELDMASGTGVRRHEVVVGAGDDLEQTTGRAIYADHRVDAVRAAKGEELLTLSVPGDAVYLGLGKAYADVDGEAVERLMIRRTIQEHLEKEKRLRPQGIKVLSLFFIDAVDKYRRYDEDGRPVKGEYAEMFEAEYQKLAKHPDYSTLFDEVDLSSHAAEVHDGYFSIDKKGGWADTAEGNQTGRDSAERAYNLIMKDKERLLSLETPLKFIFSHSALKEGWDNPNVFQICSLREMGSERERRQTIGRGLRICVDQSGERVRTSDVNTLTVVATESYEEFAENLQKEIEKDTGIRFGLVEKHHFATIVRDPGTGDPEAMGVDESAVLWEALKTEGYLDAKGRVQDALKTALKDGTLVVPKEFAAELPQIISALKKVAGGLEVKNADERKQVHARKKVLLSDEFKALWDRIKHKTTYRVEFDNEKLIADCTEALRTAPAISKTTLQWRKAGVAIGQAGVTAKEKAGAEVVTLDEDDIVLPDLLTELQDRTSLTRRSIYRIVTESGRLNDFKRNPQQFIDTATKAIKERKQLAIVDGIRYQKIGDDNYYAQELFEQEDLTGYLRNLVLDAQKSVYEDVIYDSGTEKTFAIDLERNKAVKVYAKLPGWFEVKTPLGGYNPDWAVLVEDPAGGERLYFVVETKSSLFAGDLRQKEVAKIKCGAAHFAALGVDETAATFLAATTVAEVLTH